MSEVISRSQERESSRRLKDFFYASPVEITLYIVVGLVMLLVLNASAIASHITGESASSTSSIGQMVNQDINNILSHGRVANVLFWSIVGIFVYLFLWLLRNVMINLYNDFANDKFVHPTTYSSNSYWRSVLGLKTTFILSVVGLVIYGMLLMRGMKWVSHQFYLAIIGSHWLTQIPIIIGAVLISAFATYLLVKLVIVALNLWRSMINGF